MKAKRLLSLALSLLISSGAFSFTGTAEAGTVSDLDGLANWLMYRDYENYRCCKYSTTDEYEVGYVVITGFKSGLKETEGYLESVTSIELPDYIDNLPVAVIGSGAFMNCTNLKSVTLTNKIEIIEGGAFSGCSSLTSIVLPKSIETIEWYAFSECTALTEVTIPERVSEFDTAVFNYCSSLTDITIMNPDCVISDNAFHLDSLTTIHGYYDSTAEALAEELGIEFIPLQAIGDSITRPLPEVALGDVNSDGTIDPVDATLVLQQYSVASMNAADILNDNQKLAANVNKDNVTDPVDATWILRYYSYASMNGKDTIEDFIKNN